MQRWLRRVLWLAGAVGMTGAVGFAAGALITDRLEQDNAFCVACHRPEKPLHAVIYATFFPSDGKLLTLAAAHNVKGPVKCIDCHIGVGVGDYLTVKAKSAWDAAKWLVGDYRDPQSMTYSLGDRTCLKCHSDQGRNPRAEKAFHNAPYHRDPRNRCSDCHRSHVEAPVETRFLLSAIVQPRCNGCHQAILGIPAE